MPALNRWIVGLAICLVIAQFRVIAADQDLNLSKADWRSVSVSSNGQQIVVGGCEKKLLWSIDAGATWSLVNAIEHNCVGAMHFIDDRNLVIGGDRVILVTADRGNTWVTAKLPKGNTSLTRFLFAADGLHGWATTRSNGRIVQTSDGGKSWSVIRDGNANEVLEAVWFDNSRQVGWVGGSKAFGRFSKSLLLRTVDGGKTWTEFETPSVGVITEIRFDRKGKSGWMFGAGGIAYQTRDGGNTWEPNEGAKSGTPHIQGLTADGRWDNTPRPNEPYLAGVYLSDSGDPECGIGYGAWLYSNGVWSNTLPGTGLGFERAAFSDDGSISVGAGYAKIFISTDRCRTWKAVSRITDK